MDARSHSVQTSCVMGEDLLACRGFGYGWEVFMDMMAPLIRRAPYMLSPGAVDQSVS